MPDDGPRWELLQITQPCGCGTRAGVLRNCRSGARVVCQHNRPDGKRCKLPIGAVVRVEERTAPNGFPFVLATELYRVWDLDQADRIATNLVWTRQPWTRAPVQGELFGERFPEAPKVKR